MESPGLVPSSAAPEALAPNMTSHPQLRVLIIDDEPPARDALRMLLAPFSGVTVVGEAGRLEEARAQLARDDYNLVFLDIQLRGGTGFALAPLVRPGARIVFVTAFDAYAVRAFEVNALDYLMKPVARARLADCLMRLSMAAATEPDAVMPALASGDLVELKTNGGTSRFVRVADVALVQSCQNYSEVRLASGERHIVRQTMKSWEERLPADKFVRVHRESIVGLAHIRGTQRISEEITLVEVAGEPEPVRASYRHLPLLREKLAALGTA